MQITFFVVVVAAFFTICQQALLAMYGILKDNEKIEPKTGKQQRRQSPNSIMVGICAENQNILSQCIHFKMVMRIKIYVRLES